jgi:hypothetical protein
LANLEMAATISVDLSITMTAMIRNKIN